MVPTLSRAGRVQARPLRRRRRAERPEGRSGGRSQFRLSWAIRRPWVRALAMLGAGVAALVGAVVEEGLLRLAFGSAAPLAPVWLIWLGLASIKRLPVYRPGNQFVLGAGLLSLALPPLLSLGDSGGLIGQALFEALQALLGRAGAVFVLLLAAASAPLLMLGRQRERIALWLFHRLSDGTTEGTRRRYRRPASSGEAMDLPAQDVREAGRGASAAADPDEPELLIVGASQAEESSRRAARAPAAGAARGDHVQHAEGESAVRSASRSRSRPDPRQPELARPPVPDTGFSDARSKEPPHVRGTDAVSEQSHGAAQDLAPAEPPEASAGHRWSLPALELLTSAKTTGVSPGDLKAQARTIEQTLESFRLPVRVVDKGKARKD